MKIKRDNWTNDEVIALLKGLLIIDCPPELQEMNDGISSCVNLFGSMKADPKIYAGALALDTDTGFVVCVGRKLPQ